MIDIAIATKKGINITMINIMISKITDTVTIDMLLLLLKMQALTAATLIMALTIQAHHHICLLIVIILTVLTPVEITRKIIAEIQEIKIEWMIANIIRTRIVRIIDRKQIEIIMLGMAEMAEIKSMNDNKYI